MIDYNRLKIILLKNFKDIADHSFAQEIFGKMITLKKRGYEKEYPQGVLPLDTTDFIGTHLLLCYNDKQNGFTPIMGMKSITLKECLDHRVDFPISSITKSSNDRLKNHHTAIDNLINSFIKSNKTHELGYNGSYTIDPIFRQNKSLVQLIFEVAITFFVNFYQEYNINQTISICSKKFKIDLRKKKIGWDYLKLNDIVLPEFSCYPLFDESFVIMHGQSNSEYASTIAKLHSVLWEEKIVLDKLHFNEIARRAA